MLNTPLHKPSNATLKDLGISAKLLASEGLIFIDLHMTVKGLIRIGG